MKINFHAFACTTENIDTSFYRTIVEQIGTNEFYLDANENGKYILMEDFLDYQKFKKIYNHNEHTHPSLKMLWKFGDIVDYFAGTPKDPSKPIFFKIRRFKELVIDTFIDNWEFHKQVIKLCREDKEAEEIIVGKKTKIDVPDVNHPYNKQIVKEWINSLPSSTFDGEFPDEFVLEECNLAEETVSDLEYFINRKVEKEAEGEEVEMFDEHTTNQIFIYAIAFFRKFPGLFAMNHDLKAIVPQMIAETSGTVVSVLERHRISWYVPFELSTKVIAWPPRELSMVIGHSPFILDVKASKSSKERYFYLMKMNYHNLAIKDIFYDTGRCLCQSPIRRKELK